MTTATTENGKRGRGRPKGHRTERVASRRALILQLVRDAAPMRQTVRQIFYRVVSEGAVEKTENGYKKIDWDVLAMRKDGELEWDEIVDSSRSLRSWRGYGGVEEYMEAAANGYTRDLWRGTPWLPYVLCESDSISRALEQPVSQWGAELLALRGLTSATAIYNLVQSATADALRRELPWVNVMVYFFGDHDNSGLVIRDSAEEYMREFTEQAGWDRLNLAYAWENVALNPLQISRYGLPASPNVKRNTSHAVNRRNLGDEVLASTEIEALPVDILHGLVDRCFASLLSEEDRYRLRHLEAEEREYIHPDWRRGREEREFLEAQQDAMDVANRRDCP